MANNWRRAKASYFRIPRSGEARPAGQRGAPPALDAVTAQEEENAGAEQAEAKQADHGPVGSARATSKTARRVVSVRKASASATP